MMFTKQDKQELLDEIAGLRADIAALKKERDETRKELRLADNVRSLRDEIETLNIEKGRLTEEHEREQRETLHMVGLERKRGEFETEQAKREAVVSVREEALTADRARFDEQMKFTTDRFQSEVGYLKELMGEVLDRLPTITVDKTVAQRTKA